MTGDEKRILTLAAPLWSSIIFLCLKKMR